MKWSWLQNPTVALIGLLASVIAVVQWVTALSKRLYRLLQAEAENERYRRVRIAVVLAALVLVVAFSAVTWSVLMTEAAKGGDHGFMAVLDTLEFAFLGLFAVQTLLRQARARQRFSVFAYVLLVVTLAYMATGYFFSGGPAWVGTAVTRSSANLGIAAVVYMFFQHLRRVGSEQAESSEADAA